MWLLVETFLPGLIFLFSVSGLMEDPPVFIAPQCFSHIFYLWIFICRIVFFPPLLSEDRLCCFEYCPRGTEVRVLIWHTAARHFISFHCVFFLLPLMCWFLLYDVIFRPTSVSSSLLTFNSAHSASLERNRKQQSEISVFKVQVQISGCCWLVARKVLNLNSEVTD